MQTEKTVTGQTVTMCVTGRIDAMTASTLDKELRAAGESADAVILDLSGVTYVSSAGLRVILSLHKQMSRKGGLRLRNVCADVMEVFDLTGFKEIISFE